MCNSHVSLTVYDTYKWLNDTWSGGRAVDGKTPLSVQCKDDD